MREGYFEEGRGKMKRVRGGGRMREGILGMG